MLIIYIHNLYADYLYDEYYYLLFNLLIIL